MLDKKSSMLFIGFAVAMGCVLRCWTINQSFWWDEIWSTMTYVKANSFWDVVSSLGYYFNNHILYSLLARMSVQVLGESEFAARLPALIMGLLGIMMVFQFGETFLETRCGLIAAILLAVSAFHIDHSSEARGYSGLVLFSILSSLYFLKGVKTNGLRSWMLYIVFTVLGFYSHVFMFAVSISQFFSSFLFVALEKWGSLKGDMTKKIFGHFLVSLSLAGIITLFIYSPILATFFNNVGKVRLVDVNRIPFVVSLFNSFFPGISNISGGIVYGILFFCGMYGTYRRNPLLSIYLFVMLVLPLSLYLAANPMFVFERYFVFALPFALLIVGQGVVGLANNLKGIYKIGALLFDLLLLVYLQLPAVSRTLYQDRQNYREAMRYVQREIESNTDDLVFSIGHAGEHFRYYSPDIGIPIPATLDEFSNIIREKKRIWCLITAWLPDIRPPYEDKTLYTERPGHVEIYDYVKKHFMLKKSFSSRYPVDIYFLRR